MSLSSSQRSRFLPPAPKRDGKQQPPNQQQQQCKAHRRPTKQPLVLKQQNISAKDTTTTTTTNNNNNNNNNNRNEHVVGKQEVDKIVKSKSKRKHAVVTAQTDIYVNKTKKSNLDRKNGSSSDCENSRYNSNSNQIGDGAKIAKRITQSINYNCDTQVVKLDNSSRFSSSSRCRLLPPPPPPPPFPHSQQTSGDKRTGGEINCLDRSLAPGRNLNALGTLRNGAPPSINGGGAKAEDQDGEDSSRVYEFPVSPTGPSGPSGTRKDGKRTRRMTAAEVAVERIILRGHAEFVEILERRNKLREKMALGGACHREPSVDGVTCADYLVDLRDTLIHRCCGRDYGLCNATWNQQGKSRQDVMHAVEVHPEPTPKVMAMAPKVMAPAARRVQQSSGLGVLHKMEDDEDTYELLGCIDDVIGAGIMDGDVPFDVPFDVSSYERDASGSSSKDVGGCGTPAYVPTFLSLISEVEEEE